MRAVYTAYTLSECMEIMERKARECEEKGERTLVFCEDRLTLLAERALTKGTGGTFLSSVSTFARFLSTEKRVLSKQGSVMATGAMMAELQRSGKLRCFRVAEGIKNAAKSIYETIAQLAASKVDDETLRENAALLPEGVLKDKLSDLAEIYAAYRAFLAKQGYLDESGYLALLPDKIRDSKKARGANIFFLAFGSFTAQAKEAIRACAEVGKSVVGIFCSGEEAIYCKRAKEEFACVLAEYGEYVERDEGTPIGGEAEILRKTLFDPEALAESALKKKTVTENVRVFEAEDKDSEAEFVAANVKKLLMQDALRYRDVSVLLSDTSGYALSVKRAFDEYQIPYFFDIKKSLKEHPLSRFLLDCFAVVRERFAPRSVQSFLSNPFFGESENYRNYLLKFAAYRGGAKREIKSGEPVKRFDVQELISAREKLLSATGLIKSKDTGAGYARAVRALLVQFDCEKRLRELEATAKDLSQKSYLSQIEGALLKVLREAELLTGDKTMTVAEFEAVLTGGLEATEISLIPLKSDAVFVGDITDSRIEKARAVFALGMTDAVPRIADDTALVSDKEIEKLSELKTQIEPTVAEVNLRNRESAALNLCAFTEKLFLSYSLSAGGEEPARSEIFRYLQPFVGKNGKPLAVEKKIAESDVVYACSAPTPAIRRMILEKFDFEQRRSADKKYYAALHEALYRAGKADYENYLSEELSEMRIPFGNELFFPGGSVSPTTLEGYFTCPFSNFAERGLRLKEREETVTLAVDSGNFVHELLEKTSEKLDDFSSEAEARAYAEEVGKELLKNPLYAAQTDTGAGKYAAENLLFEGVEAAAAVYRQIEGSLYKIEATEKTIKTPDFYGKADRVDANEDFVRVIDYKTGKIEDEASSYYTGRKLQRQLYMSAVTGDRIPAGVFYFPASVSYKEEGAVSFRMSGFLNGDREAILAGDKRLTEGEESKFFKAKLSDNSRTPSVMDEATFREFIDYGVLEARQGAKEMKSGFIAPSPYEGACDYCRYGGMCGFHLENSVTRREEKITPSEIASIARKYKESALSKTQNGVPVSERNEDDERRGEDA